MQYIILDGKKPTHEFKDGKGTKTKSEAMIFDNVAVGSVILSSIIGS